MARLILSLDSQVMAEYNMTKERYTIGRLPDNDVRIDNPTVSGHHSLIINILNDSFLEDLNSTNGTYVNGKLIKKHALTHGDVITVGRHQLRYVDSDQEAEEEQDEFARTMVIDSNEMAAAHARVLEAQQPRLAAAGGTAPAHQHTSPAFETTAISQPAMKPRVAPSKPLEAAKIQVLNGQFAGREVPLTKALTTLGRPGLQVIAITRRSDGYHVVKVENSGERAPPSVNGEPLGPQARRLEDNDVIELIGIKMGFFAD